MANEVNSIDELLRRAEEMAEFPFKESDWERMSAKLDEELPKRETNPKVIWWKRLVPVSLVASALLVGALWFFTHHENPSPIPKASQLNSKAIPELTQENTENKSDSPTASSPAMQETKSIKSANLSEEKLANSQSGSTKEPVSMTNEKTVFASTKKQNDKVVNTHKKAAGTHEIPEAVNSSVTDNIPYTEEKKIKIKRGNSVVGKKTKEAKRSSVPDNATNSTQTISSTKNQQTTTQGPAHWVQGKLMQVVDTQIQWQRKVMSEEEMIRYNPRYVREALTHQAQRVDSITVIRFKPLVQQTAISFAPKNIDSPYHTYRLHAMLGTMLWRGFEGGSTWSPAPYVSIGIDKKISHRLTLAAQVGFTYFSGLNTQNRTVAYHYKFGIDSTVYTAMHKTVFRVQWPVQLQMALNKHHKLIGGLGAVWQPDGISRVSAPQQVFSGMAIPATSNPPVLSKNVLGYMHGIRAWDAFFQFGYQYQWHNRLAFQAVWQAGLRDMTNNSILGSNRIQRNNGLMLGLRYSFVRNQQ